MLKQDESKKKKNNRQALLLKNKIKRNEETEGICQISKTRKDLVINFIMKL